MEALGFLTLKSFTDSSIKKENIDKSETVIHDHKNKINNYEISVENNLISGTYINDLNLIELNECILRLLDKQKKTEIERYSKIKMEEEFKIQRSQFKNERLASLLLIKDTMTNLEKYNSDKPKKDYITEITPILNEYTKIGVIKKYVTFGKNLQLNSIDESIEKKINRLSIIEQFLIVSNKYASINISKKIVINGCITCGHDISDIESNDDDIICPNCNTEIVQLTKYKPSTENSSSNKKNNTNYEGRINFMKELSRVQGKLKNSKIPTNIVELLDKYFVEHNFPTGTQIKQSPSSLTRTNKDLMRTALKSLNLSKLYKDINLICNIYWGWELIDLEYLESKIMEKYDTINEVFEKIKNERTSALNTQYELWWILNLLEYPCKSSDFKIPKTPEIFEYHENKRKEICKMLDWEFVPFNLNML